MTEKEFYQICNSYSGRNDNKKDTKEGSGYFAYFKLRCLICLIIFLSVLILDRQLNLRTYTEVTTCMKLLEREFHLTDLE